jgi:hypothetical protein
LISANLLAFEIVLTKSEYRYLKKNFDYIMEHQRKPSKKRRLEANLETMRSRFDTVDRDDLQWNEERNGINLAWSMEANCYRCPYFIIDENGQSYHCGFTFKSESLQPLNRRRTKYHKFKLSEGKIGIIPVTLWGKPGSTVGEICRRTRDRVRKRRLRESVLLRNVPEEVEIWQGYSQCGYSLPAGRHCTHMKCLYRYCSKHMPIMD